MGAERDALEITTRLWNAALQPEHLNAALSAAEGPLGGHALGLALGELNRDPLPRLYRSSSLDELVALYRTQPPLDDPVVAHMRATPVQAGTIIPVEEVISPRVLERSEYHLTYTGFAGFASSGHLAIVLARRGAQLTASATISRPDGVPPLDSTRRQLVTHLVPHLMALNGVLRRIDRATSRESMLGAALDDMPVAFLLVGREGRILFANRAARELLRQCDGLCTDRGVLSAVSGRAARRLGSMIADAADTARSDGFGAGGAMPLPRREGRPLEVLVTPVPEQAARAEFEQNAAAAVYVTNPERDPPDPRALLAALYALTPSESALARWLLRDLTLAEAADELGITVGTARQRLKTVFAKTGTTRQASLVRLLAAGLANFGRWRSD